MLKVHGRAACVRVWRGSRERGPSVFFDAYSCGTPKVLWRKVSFRYLILDSHRKSSEKEPLTSRFSLRFKLSARGR